MKIPMLVVTLSAFSLPLFAEDTAPVSMAVSTNTVKTNATSLVLSPVRYSASIMPTINSEMGARLEKAFRGVSGLEDVKTNVEDSSIHFTVKKGAKVQTADLQKLVATLYSGAVMSEPILEHSMATPH